MLDPTLPKKTTIGEVFAGKGTVVRLADPTNWFTVDSEVTVISHDAGQTLISNSSGQEWANNIVACVVLPEVIAVEA